MYLKSFLFVLGKTNCIYHLLFFAIGAQLECELHAQTRGNEDVNDNREPCALHSLMKYEIFCFPWLSELFHYRLPVYSTLCAVAHCSLVGIAWPNIPTCLPAKNFSIWQPSATKKACKSACFSQCFNAIVPQTGDCLKKQASVEYSLRIARHGRKSL